MNEEKPVWKHEISIDQLEILMTKSITKATHHWKFTSEDTSEHWVNLHLDENEKCIRMPLCFDKYFKFAPEHRTLFQPKYEAERAYNDLIAIRAWENKHKKEIAQYKRLSAKFEGKGILVNEI